MTDLSSPRSVLRSTVVLALAALSLLAQAPGLLAQSKQYEFKADLDPLILLPAICALGRIAIPAVETCGDDGHTNVVFHVLINDRAHRDVIPRSTITKPPSAELRPDQKDSDSLPEYNVLDRILNLYIEEQREWQSIVDRTGFDQEMVIRFLNLVDRNEYKRRQAPPGLRVSDKAFGSGRRVPIVMRWRR